MGKVKSAAKKWVKQAWKDVKKDPDVIDRTIARAKNRLHNVESKAAGIAMKVKTGDVLGALKGEIGRAHV